MSSLKKGTSRLLLFGQSDYKLLGWNTFWANDPIVLIAHRWLLRFQPDLPIKCIRRQWRGDKLFFGESRATRGSLTSSQRLSIWVSRAFFEFGSSRRTRTTNGEKFVPKFGIKSLVSVRSGPSPTIGLPSKFLKWLMNNFLKIIDHNVSCVYPRNHNIEIRD